MNRKNKTPKPETRKAVALHRRVKHGRGAYVTGCRCKVCVEANREYQRRYLRERLQNGMADAHGKTKAPEQSRSANQRSPATYECNYCRGTGQVWDAASVSTGKKNVCEPCKGKGRRA